MRKHEWVCIECGERCCVGPCAHESSEGVSHHLDADGDVDYDRDIEHVALPDYDEED
jgi:hypothetical protein